MPLTRPPLHVSQTPGAQVQELGENAWRLEIPAGPKGRYRLAQLDDYDSLPRRKFFWNPPLRVSLRARASSGQIPGTWGFGLWNNPFSMAVATGVEMLRLPALPNTAWFFFATQPNYLSLRDDLPANGSLAATFSAQRLPPWLLALGAPALPLMLLPPVARWIRRLARRWVQQDATNLRVDPTGWHAYEIVWEEEEVRLSVDGAIALRTPVSPVGPLGWVMWVDNQYAALRPDGWVGFGTLANPHSSWVEIEDLSVDNNPERV